MTHPHIKTELPGPKARALLARDAKVVSPSYPRDYPFVMSHGPWHRGLGRRRQPLPRLHGRHRRVQHRAQPPGRGAGDQGCGGEVPAHLQRLLARGPGAPGRAHERAVADEGAGHELLLPVRHRECRGRAEAGALRHRARALHRLHRRFPRAHHGLARLHLEQVHPAAGLLPHHARCHARAVPEQLPAAVRRR